MREMFQNQQWLGVFSYLIRGAHGAYQTQLDLGKAVPWKKQGNERWLKG